MILHGRICCLYDLDSNTILLRLYENRSWQCKDTGGEKKEFKWIEPKKQNTSKVMTEHTASSSFSKHSSCSLNMLNRSVSTYSVFSSCYSFLRN